MADANDGTRGGGDDALSSRELWQRIAERLGARADEPDEGAPADPTRRRWLKLLGASMALAGVPACTRPDMREKIMPYTVTPPDVTPGIPDYYATSMVLSGFATGLLVESHEGRPTKVEGNPDHPASLGSTGVHEQASVLGLYDPDRARTLRRGTAPTSWEAVLARLGQERADRGAGLRLVLEPTSSPLLAAQLARVLARFPEARVVFHGAARGRAAEQGAQLAFGRPLQAQRDFREAAVILALDADFLASMPMSVRYSRDFAERRRLASPSGDMNRLYVVEAMPTPTGSLADHRLRRCQGEIAAFAAAIASELVLGLGAAPPRMPAALATELGRLAPTAADRDLVRAIARDLRRHGGTSLVVVGDHQPPAVHAVAHLLHAALGTRRAAWTSEPVLASAGAAEQDLAGLVADLDARRVDTLIVLEDNAVYASPAALELGRRFGAVETSLYLGLYEDETARACRWFVPAAHYLEAWGDARSYGGTHSLVQPLIRPLFSGRTPAEVLAALAGDRFPDAARLLRDTVRARYAPADFDAFWTEALRRGFFSGTDAPRADADLDMAAIAAALRGVQPAGAPADLHGPYEVAFVASPAVHDGRFANNPWLLELPDPITKLTWDNAAMMSEASAKALGVEDGDPLELRLGDRTLHAPALVVAGHADGAVTLPLGWGREGAESIARGVGFDAYRLRPAPDTAFAGGLRVRKLPGAPRHALATTQRHFSTEDRPIALRMTRGEYHDDPRRTAGQKGPTLSLYREYSQAGDQWAMTIDLSICSGCSACVVACQAENNVLVVGKENVLKGREMQWIRIDSYFEHGADVRPVNEPMLCQHCERAPCEYVCPVNATVHSPDGLNEQIYNRCVGTRFCSNNCPYKVRRFNWFDYLEELPYNGGAPSSEAGLRNLQRNPEVTVRERGVMEKCTYCVQRIRNTEIRARREDRRIRPNEVVTACAQACPTQAIQFGSLAHADTKMVAWRQESRSFAVLHDLGTQPRTMYLARVDNPNPELG